MTDDESVPGEDVRDNVIEELRRANPVDPEALPSSYSPEATRTLKRILQSAEAPEPRIEAPAQPPLVHRRQRRWIGRVAVAFAAVAAVVVGVLAFDARSAPDATAAVHDAAAATASERNSMRWETDIAVDLDGDLARLRYLVFGALSNGDVEIRFEPMTDGSGPTVPGLAPVRIVIVDGETFLAIGDGPWEGPVPASADPVLSMLSARVMFDSITGLADFSEVDDDSLQGEEMARYRTRTIPDDAGATMLLAFGYGLTFDDQPAEVLQDAELDVWIDGQNTVRRVRLSADRNGGSFVASTTFHGFGEPMKIVKPDTAGQ